MTDRNAIRPGRFFPLFFLPLAFVLLLIYSSSTSPLYISEGFDSLTFKTIGLGIVQGKLPYADLFDHKGPLIFYIDALGISLGGTAGIFMLQVLSMWASLFLIWKTVSLFTDSKTSFWLTVLTLIPLADFIVEGNQCEEWMLPFISLSLYLAFSWFTGGDRQSVHPAWRSLVYGISFSFLFFLRPNDAVASIGAIMTGVFLALIVRKLYRNAFLNVLAFLAGCILVAAPVMAFFEARGILGDMLEGTIFYNIRYSSAVTFGNFGWGMVIIPLIIAGSLMWFCFRDVRLSPLNFILVPYLLFTLLLIGKRDYYHYLIPIVPYVAVFFAMCLNGNMKKTLVAVSVLFALGSFQQQKTLVGNIVSRDLIKETYAQAGRLFSMVPEEDRNSVWNFNLWKTGQLDEISLAAIYYHLGMTPGNRIFVPFHVGNFPDVERIENNSPEWVLMSPDSFHVDGADFIENNYDLVASTGDSLPFEIRLYRIAGDGTAEIACD